MGRTGHTAAQLATTGAKPQNTRVAPVDVYSFVPEPPKDFDERQKEDWKQICESLLTMKALTKQSLLAIELTVYAITNARAIMADAKSKQSTRLQVLNAARISLESLGLTQTAHAKLKPAPIGAGSVISDEDAEDSSAIANRLVS